MISQYNRKNINPTKYDTSKRKELESPILTFEVIYNRENEIQNCTQDIEFVQENICSYILLDLQYNTKNKLQAFKIFDSILCLFTRFLWFFDKQ